MIIHIYNAGVCYEHQNAEKAPQEVQAALDIAFPEWREGYLDSFYGSRHDTFCSPQRSKGHVRDRARSWKGWKRPWAAHTENYWVYHYGPKPVRTSKMENRT